MDRGENPRVQSDRKRPEAGRKQAEGVVVQAARSLAMSVCA